MAEIPAIPAFSGDSWDQCSTLIHNVLNAAWKEGKIEDQAWMANFASIHFLGEALAWYACLPRDVQRDWPKLQVALVHRWSTQKGEFPAFSGDSWDECSNLIHNVRHAAWREGKIEDGAWMANFASIHFMGEALAWYARLPQDIRGDWSKLQSALANRWSTPDAALASENVTATDGNPGNPIFGLVKAVDNGSGTTWYLQEEQNVTYFGLTRDVKQAARFRFESQSTSTFLEYITAGGYPWLAMHWLSNNPAVGQGTNHRSIISVVNPETMKSSYSSSNPFQIVKFKLLSSGEVVPVWRHGKTETDLKAIASGSDLRLALDPEAPGGWSWLTLYIQKI